MSSKDTNRFTKLRVTRSRWLQHLNFLLRCRNLKLIPKFIQVKCSLAPTKRISKVLQNCQLALLRATIQNTRSNLAKIESELYSFHLKLSKEISSFFNIDQKSSIHTINVTEKHQETLNSKFNNLLKKTKKVPKSSSPTFQPVVNLSSHQLTPSQEKVLSLNSNFAISSRIPDDKLIAPIEKSFKYSKLDPRQKETLRYQICDILQANMNSHPHPNLTLQERSDIKFLKSNQDIILTKADKGGQIVVMDKKKYNEEVEILLDEGPYKKLSKDPSTNLLNKVKTTIKSCQTLDPFIKKTISPSIANSSRFYALPKVHKINIPLRPIVSNIGTATYTLAKYLVKRLSPLTSSNNTVNNSIQFIDKLKQITLGDLIMVSFDVKSLFTNIPITGALQCLQSKMKNLDLSDQEIDELLKLTKMCIENTYFVVNDQHFQQTEGLAMGSPLSPILADIYMNDFEEKLFKKLQFHTWIRYVDDTFVLLHPSNDISSILNTINSIDPFIQFTAEKENNNSIPFLDVLITRSPTGFKTSVYRKPFAVTLPPHRRSAHPYSQKMSAFYFYVNRAIHICSTDDSLSIELNYLKEVAQYRGYDSSVIDSAFSKLSRPHPASSSSLIPIIEPSRTIPVILPYEPQISTKIAAVLRKLDFHIIFSPIYKLTLSSLKDPVPTLKSWGIYQIPCQCNLSYIGQTRRALQYRLKEHENYVKKQELDKSTIATHSWQFQHHFKFSEAKIIRRTQSIHELDFLEAFQIHKFSNNLVNDLSSTPFFSQAWTKLFNHSTQQ